MYATNFLGHFLVKAQKSIFAVYHLNKGLAVHFEGCFIPCDDIPNISVLEWPIEQKNCTKMAGAYPRPQLSVDELMFMILKCKETNYVVETDVFKRSFRFRGSTVQTNNS